MATLGSRKTPEEYEEALFVTEGLLLGAARTRRRVSVAELEEVIEAATGHRLEARLLGRFLGDLVDRSYPRHMELLMSLEIDVSEPQDSDEGLDPVDGTATPVGSGRSIGLAADVLADTGSATETGPETNAIIRIVFQEHEGSPHAPAEAESDPSGPTDP